jgi:hypothetical protein
LEKWKEAGLKAKKFCGFKFYIIRCYNEEENFFKIGRTFRRIFDRFESKHVMPYDWELIYDYEGKAEEVFNIESEIKEKLIQNQYIPKIDIIGLSECFLINQEVTTVLNKYIKNL